MVKRCLAIPPAFWGGGRNPVTTGAAQREAHLDNGNNGLTLFKNKRIAPDLRRMPGNGA
jgi:hypothetical protein